MEVWRQSETCWIEIEALGLVPALERHTLSLRYDGEHQSLLLVYGFSLEYGFMEKVIKFIKVSVMYVRYYTGPTSTTFLSKWFGSVLIPIELVLIDDSGRIRERLISSSSFFRKLTN